MIDDDLLGGIEPDDAGDEEGVPADLVELHEVIEWDAAVKAAEAEA